MSAALAYVFGGPDDGATKQLSLEEISAGYAESMDAAGNVFRYQLVPLEEPRSVDGGIAIYRLEPAAKT